jgi:hypothetical protein
MIDTILEVPASPLRQRLMKQAFGSTRDTPIEVKTRGSLSHHRAVKA